MKQKTAFMKNFIYRVRPDGLAIIDVKKIDERIRIAAKFLARYEKIVVAARKQAAHSIIQKFAEIIGAKAVPGRFPPGMLTNVNLENYFEADVVFVVDPMIDIQAMDEAIKSNIPIVAICDTGNETRDVDLIIPANNKSAKSLALIFWLLAREILKERGKIKSYDEFKYKIEDFLPKRKS